jgi:hypothetical protein
VRKGASQEFRNREKKIPVFLDRMLQTTQEGHCWVWKSSPSADILDGPLEERAEEITISGDEAESWSCDLRPYRGGEKLHGTPSSIFELQADRHDEDV